jgi:hypothetical protein
MPRASTEPRLGIPRRSDSGHDAALRHVATESSSTPASPAASGWSCWSGRRRPLPSRCATSRAGGVGRSCRSGCGPTQRPILVEVRNGIYPRLNGPQSTRCSFSFTCWEVEARRIAEPMSAGRLTWKDATDNTMRESVPSRLEGGNGFCSIPNVAKLAAKP